MDIKALNQGKTKEDFLDCVKKCRMKSTFAKRDPKRISPILDEVQRIWQSQSYYDCRTFQFFEVLMDKIKKMGINDPWQLEDDKVLDMLKQIR